jgi:membrane-associated phospholipid phosphatase
MHWLQTLDVELFRLINQALMNPVFDVVMPWVSGNACFAPAVVVAAVLLVWRGRTRGALCVLMLALVIGLGDGLVANTIKHAVGRERPFLVLPDVHCLVGKGGSGSMPSSHAANWFAAAMVLLIYYRRSAWFMFPAAALVSFSRIYNGVHYPSDVLAGAILGAGYAVAFLWLFQTLWRRIGQRWFPLWWERLPSLLAPPSPREQPDEEEEASALPRPANRGLAPAGFKPPHLTLDTHWLRLGYIWIAVLLIARWAYLASGTIQLSEDEAYQWLWSKHLAPSYYSKPPLIAYTQFLGTSLWGDTVFGVRFFSPVIAAILSLLVLRFFAREVNARAGFFLVLIVSATPLTSAGALLMTVDPLSVLFWTAAMLAGWQAVQERGTTRDWLWVGLWMGLGFLSKYTELLQFLCWAVFFVLWRPARKHLRRPGPWLAVGVNLVCALPVLIWNAQRDWPTVTHLAQNAGADRPWQPTLQFLGEFLGGELGALNPVFFVATIWAGIAMWRRHRHNPMLVYFFSMGAPLFLAYLLHSFRSNVQANWIAPSVLPLFCMMVIFWDARGRLGVTAVQKWLTAGLALGFPLVILAHNTDLIAKLTGRYLPVNLDLLHRVRQWDTTARAIGQVRERLLSEGKPVFIITDHYGMAGQVSFYLPEARAVIRETPLVYCRSSAVPENQFYYWQGYAPRKGENAIYVLELSRKNPEPHPPSERLRAEFDSVEEWGVTNIFYHDHLLHPLQIFACRGLR